MLPPMPPIESCRPRKRKARLCASDEDVVDGDVDELDEVADGTHDQETDTNSLADLDL